MKTSALKTVKQLTLLALLLIGAQSCMVTSIHPIYSDDVKAHLQGLEGTWTGNDIEMRVENLSEKEIDTPNPLGHAFRITYMSSTDTPFKTTHDIDTTLNIKSIGKISVKMNDAPIQKTHAHKDTTIFIARLLKLGNQYYADLILEDNFVDEEIKNVNMRLGLMSVHLFCKLKLTGDNLRLDFLEEEAFEKFVETSHIKLNFIKRNGRYILSSDTKSLQRFLMKYTDEPFLNNSDNALQLKRKK